MSSSSEPEFVHPPDDLFIKFSEYFINKYDIFKEGGDNSDWFDRLNYRLQTEYNFNPTNGVSLLKILTGLIVVKYLEATKLHSATMVRIDDPQFGYDGMEFIDSSDIDEDLIDKVNMFIQLPYQGNTSDKRLFVDFLNTLLRFMREYHKPNDRDFQMVEGPVDRKYLLDDQSFAGEVEDGVPKQVKESIARWYNPDGTQEWRPTRDFISELEKIKKYASVGEGNYSDFNVVGPYGRFPWMTSLTKKVADERLQTYREDRDPDEIVADYGDTIPTRYLPIQDIYDVVFKDNTQRPRSLNSKVTRLINHRLFRTTLYLLEKFIYEIDQGNYGRLDYDEKPYSFILKKTEYLRLFYLDHDFKKSRDWMLDDKSSLSDRAMNYISEKLDKNKDKDIDSPFYHEYNRIDESIYRAYYLLSVNMDIYDDIDEIDLLVEGNITKLFNLFNNDIPEYSAIRREIDTEYTKFINNIKNKAIILYALKANTEQLYTPRKFTDIQPNGEKESRSPYSVDNVNGDQVFKQTIKVMELSFFKKLLNKLFNTTDYHEGIQLYPDPNLFKEMFAHYEILKEQLRPAPGNPPFIIMPHLHDERSHHTVESFSIYQLQKINEKEVYKLFTGLPLDHELITTRERSMPYGFMDSMNKGFIWLNKEIKNNVMRARHLESSMEDKRTAKQILEKQYQIREYMLEQFTIKHDHLYEILDEPGFEEYAKFIHGDDDENDHMAQYDFGTIFDMMHYGSLKDYTEDKAVEDSLVYLWPERREYRKSILENNPAYVFKKASDYGQVEDDPFGIHQGIDDNLGITDLLPKREKLGKDQLERLNPWYSPGQSVLTFRKDKEITEELRKKAKEEYRKSYLTTNPFASEMAKKSALISGIKDKSKQFRQSRDRGEQREIGKEIMDMNKLLSKMGESFYKKAPDPRNLKDIKSTGGPIFRKWKRTPEEIENLRNKLEKEDYNYVSQYVGPDIEEAVVDSYEEDVGNIGQDYDLHEEALKSRLIREIIKQKGVEEELDDSDLMEEYHKQYELDLPNHIKRKLFTYDIDKLIEIMNKLYSNILPYLNSSTMSKIHKNSIDQGWTVFNYDIAFGSKSDEELKEDAITIIMKIINVNKNMNPEYKLSDVVSDLGNMEYEMALKEGDELVKDPYGNLVIDYSKKQTTNPLEYPTNVQELLRGRTVIGDRDGVPVHDEYIRYKQPSLEGGKKKKSRRKTRKKKKRKTIRKKKGR